MDILFQLSDLLVSDNANLTARTYEYVDLSHKAGNLLDQITEKAGEELVNKYIDIQSEIDYHNALRCFLQGLRLGVQLLGLQGS